MLVREGRLSLDADRLLAQWRAPGEARGAITLAQLMQMTSGLAFDETYDNPLSDVTRMLLATGDGAAFAAAKPLESAPGARWSYSSGTSYLLARVLREAWPEDTLGVAARPCSTASGCAPPSSSPMQRARRQAPRSCTQAHATGRASANFCSRTACGTANGSCQKGGSGTWPP